MLVHQLVWLAALSLAASFVVSLLIVVSQKWHGKLSHDHDLDGVQKVHTTAVPRIGGIAVLAGVVLGVLLFVRLFPGEIKQSLEVRTILLLLASVPAFAAGIIEDVTKRVPVRVRLAATVLSALLASVALGATVDGIDIWGVDNLLKIVPIAIIVTATVVAGGANAINIIDGFNGLAGSTVLIMTAGLVAVAVDCGDAYIAARGVLCAGATVGFLLFNFPTGKLFLGDGGAYFLGFWVAELAVLLLVRNPAVNAWQVLAICAYPVIEVLFSIYRRKFIKNTSPGAPDALHLHALVYRRLVFRHVRPDAARPWKRNAAVTCVVAPTVALGVIVAVRLGALTPVAMAIVAAQVVCYVLVYGRLVRGRWTRPDVALPVIETNVNTELR